MKRSILLLYIALFWGVNAFADAYDDAASAGTKTGAKINSVLGSPDSINDKLTKPTTSKNTTMNALQSPLYQCPDNNKWYNSSSACSSACPSPCSKGFSAQMIAPSSKSFLDLFIHISASGDIDQAIFRQDLDFDGTFDNTYTVPYRISGVCANGFISCSPGTWNACRYFKWSANASNRQISVNECLSYAGSPTMDPLGGCYCTNNSCGSNLVQDNLQNILEALGGGAVASIQYSNSCTVTRVEALPLEYRIVYYGQDTKSMSAVPAAIVPQAGPSNPENYYKNATGLETAGANLASSQNSTPGTLGYLAMNNPATTGQNVSTYTCKLVKTPIVTVEWDTRYCYTNSNMDWFGVGDWEDIRNYTCYNWDPVQGRCRCSDEGGDWQESGLIPGDPPQCTNDNVPSGGVFIGYRRRTETGDHTFRCFRRNYYSYLVPRDVLSISQTGTCNPPSGCSLFNETLFDADGNSVKTWDKGKTTGLKPLASCQTLSGQVDTYKACADGTKINFLGNTSGITTTVYTGSDAWWRIDREFRCTASGGGYDMSEYIARKAHIDATLDASDMTNITFEDRRKQADGSFITPSMSVKSHANNESYGNCEQVCTVRINQKNTDASIMGNKSQYQRSTSTIDEYLKLCQQNDSGAWECPLETGETVSIACGCSNNFAKTITTLSVVDEASRDMICSPKAP